MMGVDNVTHSSVRTGILDPKVMLRKGIYDKVAAEIILQQFLDFYNSDAEKLVTKKMF